MAIDVSLDKNTGSFRFSYKRHVLVALGLLLVGGGLATLSSPWWLPLLEAAFGKVGLTVQPSYQWLLGGTEIALGLGFLAIKHFVLDRRQERLEADRALVRRSPLNFDRLRLYLTTLADDHSYTSRLHSEFYEAWTGFAKPESSFRVESTAARYRAFAAAATDLEEFIGPHFWVFPNGRHSDEGYQYCLAPHLNMDRQLTFYDEVKEKEYESLSVRLHQLVATSKSTLMEFAEELKTHGHV